MIVSRNISARLAPLHLEVLKQLYENDNVSTTLLKEYGLLPESNWTRERDIIFDIMDSLQDLGYIKEGKLNGWTVMNITFRGLWELFKAGKIQ